MRPTVAQLPMNLPQVFTYRVSNQALHITYHEYALLTTFFINTADIQRKLQLRYCMLARATSV